MATQNIVVQREKLRFKAYSPQFDRKPENYPDFWQRNGGKVLSNGVSYSCPPIRNGLRISKGTFA